MTERSELERLVEDLEKATEGSRELSDTALRACGWTTEVLGDGDGELFWLEPPDGHGVGDYRDGEQPDPTQNLQDALLTVPEGYSVRAFVHPDISHMVVFKLGPLHETVNGLDRKVTAGPFDADGKKPALALVTASMRALAAAKEDTPQ